MALTLGQPLPQRHLLGITGEGPSGSSPPSHLLWGSLPSLPSPRRPAGGLDVDGNACWAAGSHSQAWTGAC